MKQRIGRILVLTALVLCAALLLTSCNALSVSKVKKDPSAAITEAIKKTTRSLYGDNDVFKVISQALNKGNTVFTYEQPEGDYNSGKSELTLYTDIEKSLYSMNISLYESNDNAFMGGNTTLHTSNTDIFFDGTSVAVRSEDINDGSPVGTDLTALPESFESSPIFDLTGTTYAEFESAIGDMFKGNNGTVIKDFIKDFTDIIDSAEVEVADGTADIFGTETKAILVTYTFDSEDLNNIYNLVNAVAGKITGTFAYNTDTPEINEGDTLTASFALNPVNGMLMQSFVSAESDGESSEVFAITLGQTPAESPKLELIGDGDDSSSSFKCVIDREDTKDTAKRTFTITSGGETTETYDYSYDKESGDFTISTYTKAIDSNDPEDGENSYIAGSVKCEDGSVEISFIPDAQYSVVSESFKLTFNVGGECPAMPSYEEIADMDKDALTGILSGFQGGSGGYSQGYLNSNPYSSSELYADSDFYSDYSPSFDYDADGDTGDSDDYTAWEEYKSLFDSQTSASVSVSIEFREQNTVGDTVTYNTLFMAPDYTPYGTEYATINPSVINVTALALESFDVPYKLSEDGTYFTSVFGHNEADGTGHWECTLDEYAYDNSVLQSLTVYNGEKIMFAWVND